MRIAIELNMSDEPAAVSCSSNVPRLGGVGLGFGRWASRAVHGSVHGRCMAWCMGGWCGGGGEMWLYCCLINCHPTDPYQLKCFRWKKWNETRNRNGRFALPSHTSAQSTALPSPGFKPGSTAKQAEGIPMYHRAFIIFLCYPYKLRLVIQILGGPGLNPAKALLVKIQAWSQSQSRFKHK